MAGDIAPVTGVIEQSLLTSVRSSNPQGRPVTAMIRSLTDSLPINTDSQGGGGRRGRAKRMV